MFLSFEEIINRIASGLHSYLVENGIFLLNEPFLI